MDDGDRFFTSHGRRWRRTDPSIPEPLRQELVNALMAARRRVKSAGAAVDGTTEEMTRARAAVNDAKVALGERGRPWWEPLDPDAVVERARAGHRALRRQRGPGSVITLDELAAIVSREDGVAAAAGLLRRVGGLGIDDA